MSLAELLAAKKGLHALPAWEQAARSSRDLCDGIRKTINRKNRAAPTAARLPIIASTDAAALLIEAAGMRKAVTDADAQTVAQWLATNLAGMECTTTARVFLPLESVSKIEACARQFITRTIVERKRAEAEAAGRKLIAAAARFGKSPAELLADLDARNHAPAACDY